MVEQAVPLLGVAAASASSPSHHLRAAAVAALAFAGAGLLLPPRRLVVSMRAELRLARPALGIALLLLIELFTSRWALSGVETLEVAAVVMMPALIDSLVSSRWSLGRSKVTLALIGSRRATEALARDLEASGTRDYRLAGRISAGEEGAGDDEDEMWLGRLAELPAIVRDHGVDSLVIAFDAPRYLVLDALCSSCLGLPVRVCDVSDLYEEVFRVVPPREINAAWFQHLMNPRAAPLTPPSKRAFDLPVALVASLVLMPIALIAALLVRRDGGPALFRQVRVGERGKPFTIIKLRSMKTDADSAWATDDDARITRLGRFLRKSHIDEIPQLINVLRGEMSLVGPRPEQPGYVEQLERMIPYYTRRHVMKPGITGWAQVRCGYGGSEDGSLWKVAHDLYYMRHRSMLLDLTILWATGRSFLESFRRSAQPRFRLIGSVATNAPTLAAPTLATPLLTGPTLTTSPVAGNDGPG